MTAAAVVAFAATLLLTPLVLALLRRRQLVDVPNERSSHTLPTPRGGGVAVAAGTVAGLAVADVGSDVTRALLVTALLYAAIGLADDLRSVAALVRLAVQVGTAALALVWLLTDLSGSPLWRVTFAAGCIGWLVSYVNAFNFMDGINGISAAQAIVAGGTWAIVGELEDLRAFTAVGLVVAASALAFAPFNFPRAQVFLGDVGSYFLGAWLAAGTIVAFRLGIEPEVALAPLVLYLADTSTTIVRRVRAGDVWHAPHRSHAYQRLTDLGWSHARTTLAVAALMATCSAVAVAGLDRSVGVRVMTSAAVLAVAAAYVSLPSLLAPKPVSA
jgi:UDP-GlcNAc:undecaprenyl-phosphate/decaprenyl-phosphate GlcNAc-1-phosphate transferase